MLCRAVIKASPTEIKYLVKQSKNREQYDPMCRGIRVVETIDDSTSVVHFVDTKYFFNRDFCIIRHSHTTVKTSSFPSFFLVSSFDLSSFFLSCFLSLSPRDQFTWLATRLRVPSVLRRIS